MKFGQILLAASSALAVRGTAISSGNTEPRASLEKRWYPIAPKVMLISMFSPEAVWDEAFNLDQNITVPGLSPLFPEIKCDSKGDVCTFVTGEAEINAAATVSAVLLAQDKFDFSQTYFLIAGIAGVNPYEGTTGSVGLARYAVQVALAYEIDAREIPSNWSTGYWLLGSEAPGQPAVNIYGTEVFELNTNLRDKVKAYADGVQLNDTDEAIQYRANYPFAPANEPPKIFYGDVSTSDVYFTGPLLGEAFGNITKQWTNGTGNYALTAQEDNASFEAMIRADKAGLMDFSRVILMRTASDFDRAPPGQEIIYAFETEDGGFGFPSSIANILIAGKPMVEGILNDWNSTFANGVAPQAGWKYNADDLHTLAEQKRDMQRKRMMRKRFVKRS